MRSTAPDITEAILAGTRSARVTAESLRETIPLDWSEQRRLFGLTDRRARASWSRSAPAGKGANVDRRLKHQQRIGAPDLEIPVDVTHTDGTRREAD